MSPQTSRRRQRWFGVLLLTACSLFTGCATSCDQAADSSDPFEKTNRAVFEFNQGVEEVAIEPVTDLYRTVLPEPVREPISNALGNLAYPSVIANDLLQFRLVQAASDTARFSVNSIFGIAGLFDPATPMGLPKHETNFGATMGVWGFEQGPYLVLPILGPTTFANLGEIPLRVFTNPMFGVGFVIDTTPFYGVIALRGIDLADQARPELERVYSEVEPYTFLREAFLARQQRLIEGADAGQPFAPPEDVGEPPESSAPLPFELPPAAE